MPAVILDTDIGTDVDDALALALLLGSPEVDLVAVSTVYGDTLLRARLAQRLLRLAGRDDVPVTPGAVEPLSGKPVWWAGHEGARFPDLGREEVDASRCAVEVLTSTVAQQPGTVDVVAVGPLTNLALALRADPSFADNVRGLYVMGGDFSPGAGAEHNLASDATAAAEVFASRLPVTVTGLDVTTRVRLEGPQVERIGRSGALGEVLQGEVEEWFAFRGNRWTTPHDPLAALTLLTPDLFGFTEANVTVAAAGEQAGTSRAAPSPGATGPGRRTRVTSAVGAEQASAAMLDRICAANRSGPASP